MRVLHVTTEFPPIIYGGLGTAVGGLVNASARAGMTVGVLLIGGALVIDGKVIGGYGHPTSARNASGDEEQILRSSGGIEFLQVAWNSAIEPSLRLVRTWRPDLVHLHTHWVWPVARAIQEETQIPVIYTVHSLDRAEYEFGNEVPNLLDRCPDQEGALAAADRIVVLTRHESDLLSHYYPWLQEGVRIVGNGIDDYSGAREAIRKKRRKDPVVVLYSGRLVERKGVSELFATIPRILEKAPTTRFVLVGGPANCPVHDVVREWLPPNLYPYGSQIHFTGWLPPQQVAKWYRAADILVVPSHYEPFGMVILEGMLHGLPIVAADVGGPGDILEHERSGLLFPPRDVEALTRALLQLVHNPALRKKLGTRASIEVRRKWLWPRLVKKMHKVYQETLGIAA
jgi:glycogen synthase